VLSGQAAAQYAGPSVIISFVLTGFLAFLTSLSFSELAAMMTASGAAYTYTYAGQLLYCISFSLLEIFLFSLF
jgi:APA family basic amino acid/polyamine antiporter